jgi:hypothetical protein
MRMARQRSDALVATIKENAMNAQAIGHGAACDAGVRSRRVSLGGLAGAGLAAAFSLVSSELATARKRKKRTCEKQKGDCRSSVSAYCEQTASPDAETCEAALISCCGLLKGCNAGGFYDCLIDALITLEA